MSAQKGYLYEANASKVGKPLGLTDGTYDGSKNQGPDVVLYKKVGKKTITAGCELKIMPTAAGSLVMQYKGGKWNYGPTDGDEDKEFLKKLGEKNGVLERMNKGEWKGVVPNLQYDAQGNKFYVGKHTPISAYKADQKLFGKSFGGVGDIYIPIDSSQIANYYITKGDFYMSVGTHGFYILKDVFDLNSSLRVKIPKFADSVTAKIRVRYQDKTSSESKLKGTANYQFALTMQFSGVSESPYHLFPVTSKENVSINSRKISKELVNAFKK